MQLLQERKGWLPARPKKRRRPRPAGGTPGKASSEGPSGSDGPPKFARSVSLPGGSAAAVTAAAAATASKGSDSDEALSDADAGATSLGGQIGQEYHLGKAEVLSQASTTDSGLGSSQELLSDAGSGSQETAGSLQPKQAPPLVTAGASCNFCLSRAKNAGIIHGRIIHNICCYPCAKKLYKEKKPCPMCRRRIEKIAEIMSG